MMLLSFGVAITFMFFGYWLVLPFTGWKWRRQLLSLAVPATGSLQEVITFSADEVRWKPVG